MSNFEFSLIDWIRGQSGERPEVELGIGDDAALLASVPHRSWISAVDVITEGRHFTRDTSSLRDIGRKALAVNLSDMAAMAGEPVAAFIGLVLPHHLNRPDTEELLQGLFELAREWNVQIAGGDTNVWDGGIVLSVTLMGLTHPRGPVIRSGAKVGDRLFVTGALGGSLNSGRHLRFTPRIREAQWLHEFVDLHAMIDVSDGVAGDVRHILKESNVGVILDAAKIPIHIDVPAERSIEERLHAALTQGEDFELLFTVSAEDARKLESTELPFQCTCIGEVVSGGELSLCTSAGLVPLTKTGWVHGS